MQRCHGQLRAQMPSAQSSYMEPAHQQRYARHLQAHVFACGSHKRAEITWHLPDRMAALLDIRRMVRYLQLAAKRSLSVHSRCSCSPLSGGADVRLMA